MNITGIILLVMVTNLCMPVDAYSQRFLVDSLQKSVDVDGEFNGAEIHLPAVKKPPEFPSGKKAWQDFLRSNINIKVPFEKKAIPGIYRVMVYFLVGSDGNVKGTGSDTNCGYGMESEVIRCIKKSGKWIPAETTSKKKVMFTVRTVVIFTVEQNDILIGF